MKKITFSLIALSLIIVFTFPGIADSYWIWTPQTKKFINPKYAVKDSPGEQYDWAMSFYDAKDFQRAAVEFEKLARQYEFSEYASKSQYYVGLCYENMGKYYIAFQNYQKAIDDFPHIANTDEILAREFTIGNIYLGKESPKILGTDIMPPLDRAVEIFRKVVENAPYGKHAEEAQFSLGEALKKSERYDEAVTAFHKIVEDYPNSKLITRAMYEESHCAYKASLKPAYDASATDNAIKTFEKFTHRNKDAGMAESAIVTMKRLKDNVSEKSFRAAEFYEAQGKALAAVIYYQDVVDSYPNSAFADKAKARIDALKAKGSKKVSPPPDQGKKKSNPITGESRSKKPWKPFSFKSKKPSGEIKISPKVQDIPGKKPWSLFNFGAKKESMTKEAPVKEIPAKSRWKPLNFDSDKELAVKDAQKNTKWKPLYFGTNNEPMGAKK
jgi:outer membrane assembly lipoprotein YfiO